MGVAVWSFVRAVYPSGYSPWIEFVLREFWGAWALQPAGLHEWPKEADSESVAQALRRLAQLNQAKVYLFWKDINLRA